MAIDNNNISTSLGVDLELEPDYKPESKNKTYIRPEGIKGITPNWTPSQFDPKTGSSLQRYNEVALNPIVKMAIDLRLAGVMSSGHSFKPQNDYDKYPQFEFLDLEILDSINNQLAWLPQTFDSILKELHYSSIVYGWTIAEMSFDYYREWCISRFKVLPSFQFDIWTDGFNEIERLFHLQTGVWVEDDHLKKFVIGTYPFDILANKYGRSELQPIFNDVKLIEILEQYRAKAIQALCVKPIIYYYNPQKDDSLISAGQNAVAQLESFSVIPFPLRINPSDPNAELIKDDLVEVMEDRASADGLAAVENAINQIQKRILNALGIPDDLGFTSTPAGSYAKSQTELDIFNSKLMTDQDYIEGIINEQLVPSLVEYNYRALPDNYKCPKFQFNTVEDDTKETLVDSLIKLIKAGIIQPTEKWIRDLLEIPTDDSSPEENKQVRVDKEGKELKSRARKPFFKRLFGRS